MRNDFYSIEAVQIKENRIKTYIEISKELGLQIKINFDDETPREISISGGGEQLTAIVKNYEVESLYLNTGDGKKTVEKDQIDMTIIESVVEKVKSPFFIDELWYRIQERGEVEEK